MAVVARIVAARDTAVERRTDLVEEYRKREETQDRIRARLTADLAAARQQLDQVRALCSEGPFLTPEEVLAILDAAKCPRCGSPDPKLHPAVQFEGEVHVCPHPWHLDAPARPAGHDETGQ
jgi:hypothetical protein